MMTTNGKDMEKSTPILPSSSEILTPESDDSKCDVKINDYLFVGKELRCLSQLLLPKCGDGSVFKGFWKENEVAVRRVEISECTANWKDIVDKHLTNDNVLKIFGYEESSAHFLYFSLELYGATLEQFCNGQYTGPMPTDAQVLYQIANGINFLHSKGLEHGNLKPQTVLVSQGQPVRMKISDFGLRKCFVKLDKTHQLSIKEEPQTLSLSIDDDEFSIDSTGDSKEIPRTLTFTAQNKLKDSSSHPGIWLLAGSWSLLTDEDGDESIEVNPSVHGDVFAAGCLFFYFLKRGLHPFGDPGAIIDNITAKNPINLNQLDRKHFAYKPIQNLICEPPTDGKQWLHVAAQTFQDILPLKIVETKEIGRGGFGTVYAGTYEGKDVAVKKMPAIVAEENRTDFEREMELHKQLDHKNVLKLLHVEEEKDPLYKYLVLELCSGTLSQYCDKKKRESEGKQYKGPDLPDLPPDAVILYQIAIGLDYIHSRNLVHRDIKPDNVLISITKPVHVKLSDFGFCKKVSPQGTFSQSGLKGTLNWMAPEMLEILNANPDIVPDELPHGTIESDTFSAGCVFFFLLARGSHPFGNSTFVPANICNDNPVTLRNTEKKLKDEDHLAQSFYELIGKMIKKKEERIALTEVIQQLTLTALVPANRKFNSIEKSIPKIFGICGSRFHPMEPVLACGSGSSVIVLKAPNGSVPFSNWRIEQEFKGKTQEEEITALEWNVNGTQLAVGCKDGTVVVWSYPSGDVLQTKNHSNEVYLLAWNPFKQNVLATRHGKGGDLLLWNSRRENGDVNQFLTLKHDTAIWSVQWISANQIAIGLENGEIEIWEIDEDKGTSRVVKQLIHSKWKWVIGVQWNEATKYLASCSRDGCIKIWSMDSDQPIHSLEVHSRCFQLAWRRNVKTDNDGGIDAARKDKENFTFACGLQDESIVIWSPLDEHEENKKRILPRKHSDRVESLSFSPDGRFLASADAKDELIIWSTETWLPVFTCQNAFHDLSWMSTDSSPVPTYKLTVKSLNKIFVVEQTYTE